MQDPVQATPNETGPSTTCPAIPMTSIDFGDARDRSDFGATFWGAIPWHRSSPELFIEGYFCPSSGFVFDEKRDYNFYNLMNTSAPFVGQLESDLSQGEHILPEIAYHIANASTSIVAWLSRETLAEFLVSALRYKLAVESADKTFSFRISTRGRAILLEVDYELIVLTATPFPQAKLIATGHYCDDRRAATGQDWISRFLAAISPGNANDGDQATEA